MIKAIAFIFLFCAVLWSIPKDVSAQSIRATNVHFRIIDEKIEVFYDLPENNDSIVVKIAFRKKSAPKFRHYPRFLSGDSGLGVFSGSNKKIVWYYKKEPPSLFTGSDFYFKIQAIRWTGNAGYKSVEKKKIKNSIQNDTKKSDYE